MTMLLPTAYFQVVFTIPGELHIFFRRAPEICLKLLFEAVSETLTEVARTKLKATIGSTAVLHTWNQQLGFHPHLHCLVPAGGLSLDESRWISTSRHFLLPVKKLRKLFRGKLLAKIQQALLAGQILGSRGCLGRASRSQAAKQLLPDPSAVDTAMPHLRY